MAVSSSYTSWVEATTWEPDAEPSAFTSWLEAITWEPDQPAETVPSDFTAWVEATTWESYARPGFRRLVDAWIGLDFPRHLVDGVWTVLGLPGDAVADLTYSPSAFTGWISAAFTTWAKPKIGIIAPSLAEFNADNAAVGPTLVRRTYNQALPASWAASNAAQDVAAGRESLWSWKPDLISFPTSTSAKNAFSAFLDTIPDGHPCIIMAWHEPENDVPDQYTLAQWGALQNAVHTITKSKNRPELRTGICLMGPWTFDTRSGRQGWAWESIMDLDLIDVVGIDPYGTTAPPGAGATYSLERILTVNNSGSGTGGSAPSMMAKLKTWGKPISIMEFGKHYSGSQVVPQQVKSQWILDGYDWMKVWNQANPLTPIESALWFNMSVLDPPEENKLVGIEIDAYAQIVADSKIPPGA